MVLGVMVLLVTPVTWWPPRIGRQAFVRILHLWDASGHRLPPAACRLPPAPSCPCRGAEHTPHNRGQDTTKCQVISALLSPSALLLPDARYARDGASAYVAHP